MLKAGTMQWQTCPREVQLIIIWQDGPAASRGSEACIPADQARVREVAAAPEESIQRAPVQGLPPLGLIQNRGEDGEPALEGMCLSLWPSRRVNQKSCR